ncbi:hypothetical protein, partial [Propionibacterium freudenreichii]|uniref:hypothetical protein n=1 Tax=Propionibacterium freudenreichii TaxID=1744 RepID=UPI0038542316
MKQIIYSFNKDMNVIVFEVKFTEFTEINKRFMWFIMIDDTFEKLEFDRIENDTRFFKNGSYVNIIDMILFHNNIKYQCVKS